MSDLSPPRIHEYEAEGVVTLQPTGRLDAATGGPLQARVEEHLAAGKRILLLDFRALEYVNSGGLRVLMELGGQVEAASGRLAIYAPSEHVGEVLDLVGLPALVPVCGSRTEALEAVG